MGDYTKQYLYITDASYNTLNVMQNTTNGTPQIIVIYG